MITEDKITELFKKSGVADYDALCEVVKKYDLDMCVDVIEGFDDGVIIFNVAFSKEDPFEEYPDEAFDEAEACIDHFDAYDSSYDASDDEYVYSFMINAEVPDEFYEEAKALL